MSSTVVNGDASLIYLGNILIGDPYIVAVFNTITGAEVARIPLNFGLEGQGGMLTDLLMTKDGSTVIADLSSAYRPHFLRLR